MTNKSNLLGFIVNPYIAAAAFGSVVGIWAVASAYGFQRDWLAFICGGVFIAGLFTIKVEWKKGLSVGDDVIWGGMTGWQIARIKGDEAALVYENGKLLSAATVKLSELVLA